MQCFSEKQKRLEMKRIAGCGYRKGFKGPISLIFYHLDGK